MIDILFIASSSASFVSTSLSYISNEHLFSDLLHHWPLFFELFSRANGQLMFFCCECFIVGSMHRPFLSFLNHLYPGSTFMSYYYSACNIARYFHFLHCVLFEQIIVCES